MQLKTVANLSADLCEYYGKPLPTKRAVELWHTALREIPEVAVFIIFEQITEEHDCFPANVPKAIKDIYFKRGKYRDYGPQYREVILD